MFALCRPWSVGWLSSEALVGSLWLSLAVLGRLPVGCRFVRSWLSLALVVGCLPWMGCYCLPFLCHAAEALVGSLWLSWLVVRPSGSLCLVWLSLWLLWLLVWLSLVGWSVGRSALPESVVAMLPRLLLVVVLAVLA